MTTKQKILSKDIWARTAEIQPFFAFLSIIQNFSLRFRCHKPVQLCILREFIHERHNGVPIEQQPLTGIGMRNVG